MTYKALQSFLTLSILIATISFSATPSSASIPDYPYNGRSGIVSCGFSYDDGANLYQNDIVIEENVVTINRGCSGVLSIPSGVTAIGGGAFLQAKARGNSGLYIQIPNTVTSIEGGAFSSTISDLFVSFESNSRLTSIGEHAFAGLHGPTSFVIPKSVRSIGYNAFALSNVSDISFESGSELTTIQAEAFRGSGITRISVPKHVTEIGDRAFMGTARLLNIDFTADSQLNHIGTSSFENSDLVNIDLPSGVTDIPNFAFKGSGLTSIALPDGLESIGVESFANTDSLSQIEIPASVISIKTGAFFNSSIGTLTLDPDGELSTIENDAFSQTRNLYEVAIPSSIQHLGDNSFATMGLGWNKTMDIYFLGDAPSYMGNEVFGCSSSCRGYEAGYAITQPNATGFSELGTIWNRLTVGHLQNSVTYLGNGNSGGDPPIDVNLSYQYKETVSIMGNTGNLSKLGYRFDGWSDGTWTYAASGSETLTMRPLPLNLSAVWSPNQCNLWFRWSVPGSPYSPSGGVAKSGTPLLLPSPARAGYTLEAWYSDQDRATLLGYPGDAFSPICLAENSPITIYDHWVANTYTVIYNYNSATGGNSVADAGYTTGGAAIALPSPTRTGYTFGGWYSNSGLTSKIGDAGDSYSPTGTTLALNAYAKWTANTYLVIYNYNSTTDGFYPSGAEFTTGGPAIRLFTPTRIGYTFAGWYLDEELTSKIGDAGESYSPSGSSLVLNAFAKWIANTDELPTDGTYGCNTGMITESVNSYQIIDGVVSQGSGCVGGLVFPEGVIAIGENAFDSFSTGVTGVIIPASVKQIESRAFSGASNLYSVIFEPGSELESIGYAAFSGGSLVSIEIPSSVLSIGELAFSYQSELTNLTFGANSKLESIGDQAFTYNVSISSVNIPASVKSIGRYSFQHADALERVTFAAGSVLEMIDGGAFADTLSLTSMTIPSGVTHIGDSAFYGSGIRSAITIPANCTYIGEYAFAYARNLEAVKFEPGSRLTEINFKTFEGTDSLSKITIPASVEEISSYAFYLSSGLRLIHFEGNAPTRVGTRAFSDIGSDPKAVTTNDASGFGATGELWNGLKVAKVHAVNYASNGGSVVNASSFVSFEDIEMPPTVPTRVGYTFIGWSLTSSGAVVDFPYGPTSSGDITFYARWTKNPVKAVSTVKPSVSGTAKATKTLTANKGTWTGYPTPAVSYQWYACSGAISTPRSSVPTTCKKITGATKSTFKIASAQKGKCISVLVTGFSAGTTKTLWLTKSTSKVK